MILLCRYVGIVAAVLWQACAPGPTRIARGRWRPMVRSLSWADCAIAAAILLPVVALILVGRAIGLTVLAIWEMYAGDRR